MQKKDFGDYYKRLDVKVHGATQDQPEEVPILEPQTFHAPKSRTYLRALLLWTYTGIKFRLRNNKPCPSSPSIRQGEYSILVNAGFAITGKRLEFVDGPCYGPNYKLETEILLHWKGSWVLFCA